MIAYFLLVHRFPEQFKRMFQAIHAPGNIYLVHIDKNSGAALAQDIAAFLAPYEGVEILPARTVLWGGYSLVEAELRGMKRLLEMDAGWTHFINLSGQDFPLKSQGFIRDFLSAHPDTQFMRCADQRAIRPDTMNRVDHVFIEAFRHMFRTGIARAFPRGATPFIGTQWKVVTRSFCEFSCHHPLATRFKRFYKRSFIADEGFFQTLVMNGFPQGHVVDDDLRTIDWVPDGDIKLRPRTFTKRDATWLTLSPDLFARKFDMAEDSEIFDLLESHLASPAASNFKPSIDRSITDRAPTLPGATHGLGSPVPAG